MEMLLALVFVAVLLILFCIAMKMDEKARRAERLLWDIALSGGTEQWFKKNGLTCFSDAQRYIKEKYNIDVKE